MTLTDVAPLSLGQHETPQYWGLRTKTHWVAYWDNGVLFIPIYTAESAAWQCRLKNKSNKSFVPKELSFEKAIDLARTFVKEGVQCTGLLVDEKDRVKV